LQKLDYNTFHYVAELLREIQIFKNLHNVNDMDKIWRFTLLAHAPCTLPIFLYGSERWAVTKRDVHKIDALGQCCLRKLLESNGTIMCGMTMWDGQRSNHNYHLLFKHGVSPSSATLRECQTNQMPSRSYQLPPPLENWSDHQDVSVVRGWRLFSRTWNQWTCPWTKQSTWLRIVHSGDWCLRLALRTHSGACQTRTNERASCMYLSLLSNRVIQRFLNVRQQISYVQMSINAILC